MEYDRDISFNYAIIGFVKIKMKMVYRLMNKQPK